MKKSNLWIGIAYLLIGIACFLAGWHLDTRLDSLLYGFSGAGVASGAMLVMKYFYWNADKNKDRYAKRLEHEQIELNDELMKSLRDKSGRYAYIVGLAVIAVSIMVISIVTQLGVVLNARFFILYLFVYLLFQYVIGIVIFRYLNKKY